jgi:hypothetical protein
MAPKPLTFRQRDVTAAIKAIEAAGHTVSRVTIIGQDGSKVVMELAPTAANEPAPEPDQPNPWDEVPDYANSAKTRQ